VIRAESARRGLNQSNLRDALGLSRAAAFRRWHGQTPWQVEELAAVCDHLGIDLLDVLTEAGVVRPASALVTA
jgi:DNA-binding Xre family transcriptional regulator